MGLEADFIEWLCHNHQPEQSGVVVGLGDDGAVWGSGAEPKIIVSDAIAEGTHFRYPELAPEWIGRKAVAVNLSDIAAMGGAPEVATLNLQCPSRATLPELQNLFEGAKQICDQFGVALIGGDTNVWSQGWVVSVTIVGQLLGDRPWRINSAKPGELVVVSGSFGGSLSQHHFAFEPRLDLAQRIASVTKVSAATDVSDSLARDLHAILKASHCGAVIDLEKIPISKAAWNGPNPVEAALYDGEDFELILTLAESEWDKLLSNGSTEELTVIGRVTEFGTSFALDQLTVSGLSPESDRLRTTEGKSIPPRGYTHG